MVYGSVQEITKRCTQINPGTGQFFCAQYGNYLILVFVINEKRNSPPLLNFQEELDFKNAINSSLKLKVEELEKQVAALE